MRARQLFWHKSTLTIFFAFPRLGRLFSKKLLDCVCGQGASAEIIDKANRRAALQVINRKKLMNHKIDPTDIRDDAALNYSPRLSPMSSLQAQCR